LALGARVSIDRGGEILGLHAGAQVLGELREERGAVGSLASLKGRQDFADMVTDYGCTDGLYKEADLAKVKGGEFLYFPILLGAITVSYNVDGVDKLQLSPATIARANAISIRTLHRMFESTEDSVAAVIRERRLSRCRADLLLGTTDSVTAIAFRWGFRNMSFFSRVFRERYGVSARELQMAARAAARPRA
jgi:AraC-like DNA-binding protein